MVCENRQVNISLWQEMLDGRIRVNAEQLLGATTLNPSASNRSTFRSGAVEVPPSAKPVLAQKPDTGPPACKRGPE